MTTTMPASIPTTGTWRIDSVHSSVSFRVTHHIVATFRGSFETVTGALDNGILSGSVLIDDINVRLPLLKQHLMAPDWFDAASFSTLSFSSTDLHADGDRLHAAGQLTIKDVTRAVDIGGAFRGPVLYPNHDGSRSNTIGLDLVTQINRQDFGITGVGGAADDVTIEVSLELIEQ